MFGCREDSYILFLSMFSPSLVISHHVAIRKLLYALKTEWET